MGIFSRAANTSATRSDIAKKSVIRNSGIAGASLGGIPGLTGGFMIGELADDINDLYYNGKDKNYNSSYNVLGAFTGLAAGSLAGNHFGRRAAKMILEGNNPFSRVR